MDKSAPPKQETGNFPSGTGSVTEEVRLRRFLCYGSESATYRACKSWSLCLDQVPCLTELVEQGRGSEVVQEVRRRNLRHRVGISNPALFALAAITQHTDVGAKQAAYGLLKEVCTSPDELFSFVQYKKELRSAGKSGMWGRALRKGVADWYNGRHALTLAHDVTTCKRKGGWSHKDLFRLAHLKPANDTVALVSKYVSKGWIAVQETYTAGEQTEEVTKVLVYLEAVEKIRRCSDELQVVHLIEEHKLEREHLQSKHLKSREVWNALMKLMPVSTLITHLGKMTADKLLEPGNPETMFVCEKIQDQHTLLKAETHPLSILLAMENYKRGHGKRGKLKWKPNRDVVRALENAFHMCLSNVESTGKRIVVGVDVSAQLSSVALGSLVSTVTLAAAMSMVITRSDPQSEVVLFSEGGVVPCTVPIDSSLLQISTELVQVCCTCTDCTLPIYWASENDKMVDAFVIFTNNQIWPGKFNLVDALRTYRQKTGIFSKFMVCAMTANTINVADPDDHGMLDICGFDSDTVHVIHDFITDII